MRVAIAGGGNVGRSIARALLGAGHRVLVIERHRPHFRPDLAPDADWMFADACELSALHEAGIGTADVVIAATGDDKVNLVFAMLCKTEFGVPRVVARVNEPSNHWLFGDAWGVDVAVSTPGSIVASVEEAVSTGDVVHLMTLQHGQGSIVEVTLPAASRLVGRHVTALDLPNDAALLGVSRGAGLLPSGPELVLQAGDEIVLLVSADAEERVRSRVVSRL
jgi:trk system potassium uptake protein TrkA